MGDGTGAAKLRRKNAWFAGQLAWRLAKNKAVRSVVWGDQAGVRLDRGEGCDV